MNYKDVIDGSKFYLPMNLNLGHLLKDTEIVMLMNVINCDNITEKLSVRKLMRFTNRSSETVQNALKTLRTLKLIEGFKPNYKVIKFVFDSLNNAVSIDERKKWSELYRKSIQKSVSEIDTESVSETGTQIKKMYKEDLKKEDLNISQCNTLEEIKKNDFFQEFKENVNKVLVGKNKDELLEKRVELSTELSRKRIELGSTMVNRCKSYLNRKYDEALILV